jgi:cytochrome c oxidase subunit II
MGSPRPHVRRRPPVLRRRTPVLAAGVAVIWLLTVTGVASADLLTPQSGGSPNANSIDTLYKLVFALGIIIFVGVWGTLIYALFRFRARKGAVAAQIRGNTRLEIGWTVGAALILVFIAAFTFAKLPSIRNPPNSDASGVNLAQITGGTEVAQTQHLPPNGKSLAIAINGQQYVWRFTYPDGDNNPLNNAFSYNDLYVPTGTTVTLSIRAQDVAHSWWVPELGGKFDAVPGHTNYTWFKIPAGQEGKVFRGQCAELCGRNHANMVAFVHAMAPQAFEAWLQRKKQEIQQSNQAASQQRKRVEAGGQEGLENP